MAKSNIFAIDIDAAERSVAEANAELVQRHTLLLEAFDRIPTTLETAENIERAKRFARQLNESAQNCRRIRLADTKPIRDLLRRVDDFFKKMEKQATDAQNFVLEALSREGRLQAEASRLDQTAAVASSPVVSLIVQPETGEILGTAQRRAVDNAAAVQLQWAVDRIDRAEIELEALRPYLTDAALLHAVKAHLKANGPNALTGATYVQQATMD
ncbi:hypothetical protein NX862_06210 [Rhodobacter sp. KR11]|uniref:hypothetical protein n=1 Tax=Rhodobacter sp. KR11 TaxID=2974588 RepID=UPI0022215F0E|nr:hypothetical protein [Rhodobacter sp. KR11]MCW1918338.1 hypothetical protein [Rhodobacter sp. KR11]